MGVHTQVFRRDPEQLVLPGDTPIFRIGDPGECMYVIISGRVLIEREYQSPVILLPGEIFGEMALIDSALRSASATTLEECRLLRIDRQRFLYLVRESPYFALQVMQTLVERLRRDRINIQITQGES